MAFEELEVVRNIQQAFAVLVLPEQEKLVEAHLSVRGQILAVLLVAFPFLCCLVRDLERCWFFVLVLEQ